MKRRTVLASTGTIAAALTSAGCISVDPGGTKDLVVINCLDGDQTDGDADKTAEIQIQHEGSGNSIFAETVTVPEMSCSDVVDGVDREDVFPEAGSYVIAVTVDGYDETESQVEFSEREIDDNSDNVTITIQEENIDIE